MANTIGALSKCAVRIESDAGMVSASFPTTEATADTEEVLLKSSDQLPFMSEGLDENFAWSPEETLDGSPGASSTENISILDDGPIELQGYYDGIDAILACAMGFELPDATASPTALSSTALTSSASSAAGTWDDSGTPFASGDVGKFIRVTSRTAEGQVRRISGFTDSNTVSISPNWDVTPDNTTTGVMAQEWRHLFECSNNLEDELWTNVYSSYPTGGVGTSNDQILRRMTVGFTKHSTTPQVHRSAMVNVLTIKLDKTNGLTLSSELMAFNKDLSSATNGAASADNWAFDHASPLFVENERIVFSHVDHFRVDTFANGAMTSADNWGIDEFEIAINNQLKGDDQSVSSTPWRVQPGRNAMREITGTFKLPRYSSDQFNTWLTAKTPLTLELSISGSTIENVARNISIFVPQLILETVSTPVSGPGIVPITVGFRAISPSTELVGSSPFDEVGLTAPRSELLIETLNQNPFNLFRDQQKSY
ncbi:hypothetical protein LCGC14_0659170 [marine sediment metagenome]|uniref:Uncharacterized protein n=1 Tax=marine sediment metagenome TaxID=412755 RepID=A0A0F9TFN2_9ZZZZ